MKPQWTILVYMGADNNLDTHANPDLAEMRKALADMPAAASDAIRVVVQLDAPKKKTRRFRVSPDGQADVVDLGKNVNMGDPAALTEFVDWGLDTYPSTYSALILWDHGGGLEDPTTNRSAAQRPRRSLLAEINALPAHHPPNPVVTNPDDLIMLDHDDYLTDGELRQALEATKRGRVDVFGCDACLMAMLEIGYEMRRTASFMVASEANEPGTGWPYDRILAALSKDTSMPPHAFATAMVEAFRDGYTGAAGATLSAANLASLEVLLAPLDDLADALTLRLFTNRTDVENLRSLALSFQNDSYIDLGSLAQYASLIADPAIQAASKRVVAALPRVVEANAPLGSAKEATGLSIYFPSATRSAFVPAYGALEFGQRSRWVGFLKAFLDAEALARAVTRIRRDQPR